MVPITAMTAAIKSKRYDGITMCIGACNQGIIMMPLLLIPIYIVKLHSRVNLTLRSTVSPSIVSDTFMVNSYSPGSNSLTSMAKYSAENSP